MQNKYTAILVAFGLTISGTSMASLVDQSGISQNSQASPRTAYNRAKFPSPTPS